MLCNTTSAHVYADLGNAWFRYHVALIHQRHEQCGRHFLVDVGALLARAAKAARATPIVPTTSPLFADATSGAAAEGATDVPRVLVMAA